MHRLHIRLSLLMFLLYAVPGAWAPIIPLHLQELEFSAFEIGCVCATVAVGAILGPLLWGQVADRWLASERCISLCAAGGGLMLWLAGDSVAFWPVFGCCLGHYFFFAPVFSLGASLTFRHLTEPEGSFGPIRMWGTIGWIAASYLLGLWLWQADRFPGLLGWLRPDNPHAVLGDCLRWAALLAFCLSAYALTLPATPPNPRTSAHTWWQAMIDAPLHAAGLFRRRELACLALCLFGVYLTLPFSGQMTPLLIKHLGVDKEWVPATLTVAQILEVMTLAVLPWLLRHLGERRTLLVGMAAWFLALAILAAGEPLWLVIGSLLFHGIFICCFLVAGQLAVNRRAAGHFRASAQGLMQWIAGLGLLIGHLAAGAVRQAAGDHFGFGFSAAALVAAILTVILMVGFAPTRE